MAKEDFRHSVPLRVRWAEVDPQSIVFNAHYLTYCDICVTEYWRAVGIRYPEDVLHAHGVDIFVVKSTLEYHASARFDDVLEIRGRMARLEPLEHAVPRGNVSRRRTPDHRGGDLRLR